MNIKNLAILITVLGIIILVFARHNYYERIENLGKSAVASSPVAGDSVQEENTKKPILSFIGDSLTFNGNWEKYFPDADTYNYGVSGNKTSDVLARLPEALKNNPDHLFVMAGINDLWTYTSNEDMLTNYTAIVEKTKLLSPETTVYLQSILPINPEESLKVFPDNPFPEDVADRIVQLNAGIESVAAAQDVKFIDVYSGYAENGYVKEGLTKDGVHLNPASYDSWVEAIRTNLN